MAYCAKCGTAVADNAAFCGSCGSPQSAASAAPVQAPASFSPAQPQMAENVAGTLCYALGWVTGLIFYFIDKRPFVRFHAVQSITIFGILHILIVLTIGFFGFGFLTGGFASYSLGMGFRWVLDVLSFVLWIVLMIKAHQGERFRVPVAADIAEKVFGKS